MVVPVVLLKSDYNVHISSFHNIHTKMKVDKFCSIGSSAELVEDVIVAFIWRLEYDTA